MINANQSMQILIVSQYFWPENFRVNDLAKSLVERGHTVTVLTGLPNYPEGELFPAYKERPESFSAYHGVNIVRIPHTVRGRGKFSLALNYLSFFVNASLLGLWRLRRLQFDVIFVFAVSPITMAIPAIVMGKVKQAPIFLWVQDLWPETLSAVGVVKAPVLLALVGMLVRWIYARCDHVLIQSRAFFPSIKRYCISADQPGKVLYFPNWAEQIFSATTVSEQQVVTRDENVFTILFAGNMGEAQDFPSILNAAERLKSDARIRWIVVGDGRMYGYVKQEVMRRGLAHCVTLTGRFDVDSMPSFFAVADALLVTLKSSEIFSRTIPGKLQSYLAAARPILCMIDGEARVIVDESGAGMSCAAGDFEALADLALQMSRMDRSDLNEMGERGRHYYQIHFEREKLMTKLENYFRMASAGQTPGDDVIQ